ncbi:hypothetical protein DYB32_007954 [Aphanomyces invadans]|uniref:FYVE-type domain-containing protein n=1 Tax=Aphanomyces invadans TaxID=157072 RepID=A0A418AMN5_9STRA|nr:hypothetical protein DYB32_007954 [Aphanomyces invadans]
MDPTEIVRFDDMTASCRVLMTLPNSTTSVRHITAKPVFPTAARDFVVMSTMEVKPDDVVVIATRSMDHATAPATSTFVRGHINISGYILDPVDLGPEPACHVTMMAHMDLGGMLPAVVINLLSVEAPAKLLNKVRELYGTTGATASLPRRRLLPDVTACRNESTEARPDPGRSPNGGQVDGSPIARDALDNYAAFGNASIELLVANVSDASTIAWTEVKLHDGIAVYRGAVPNSDWNAVKATCVVQCPAWFLAGKLQNPADMTTFDTMTASCHVLADFSGRVSVRHVQAKPVFPTTARDFVVVTAVHEVAGSSSASDHQDRFVIASRSTTHPKAPETKQFVRGTNNISGYVVDGVDGGACRVTMMAHMDLGGMLPAVVINALAVDAPYKLLKRFRTLYELESFPRRPSIPPQPAAPATLLMESHQHLGPDVLGSTRVPDRTSYDPKTRTSRCYVCSNTMATFLLRHNCQICGHVVCGSCSTHRIHTNYWTTLRTCDTCVVHLQQKHVPALLPPQPSSTAAITTPASARAIEPALAIQPSSMFCYAFDQWKYGRRLASAAWVAGCLVLVLPVVLGVLSNSAMVDFAQAVKVYFDT